MSYMCGCRWGWGSKLHAQVGLQVDQRWGSSGLQVEQRWGSRVLHYTGASTTLRTEQTAGS